jgi:CubicO group peptidase (beta-lactamase class C family)
MRRRHFLGAAVGTAAAVPGAALLAGAAPAAAASAPAGPSGPPTVTPEDLSFHPRVLRPGSARQAGVLQEYVEKIVPAAAVYMQPGPGRPHPSHPGFALLAARDGVVVEHAARGYALRYAKWDAEAGKPVELPREEWVEARPDTIYDMASCSKLYTSVVVVRLAEQGRVDVDAPVRTYLPDFDRTDPAKTPITVKNLLTHTSGMKPWMDLGPYPDNDARMAAIYAQPLVFAPGTDYVYSDLNLITVGRMLEEITGEGLDRLVARLITEPLGLKDTGYNPPAAKLDRIAATEWQPWTGRGMVRGSVHDENSFYLGGVAGHAGVFSTAHDMAVFGQMVLNGGTYDGKRLIGEDWVRRMLVNYNAGLGGGAARGLGWQLDQRFYMDALTSPVSFGHTGYTGTDLVCDPVSGTVFTLLTNRVHPTREWGTASDYRRAPARMMARALPVRPATGGTAWFSGQEDKSTAVLRVPLGSAVRGAQLRFRLWYDTESTDVCTLEATTDGTAWQAVPLQLRSGRHRWATDGAVSGFSARRWLDAAAALPEGTTQLRWRYVTDSIYQGRGVYVDDIRVHSGAHKVFDGERPHDAARVVADGWTASRD